jgi:hypothetical protein
MCALTLCPMPVVEWHASFQPGWAWLNARCSDPSQIRHPCHHLGRGTGFAASYAMCRSEQAADTWYAKHICTAESCPLTYQYLWQMAFATILGWPTNHPGSDESFAGGHGHCCGWIPLMASDRHPCKPPTDRRLLHVQPLQAFPIGGRALLAATPRTGAGVVVVADACTPNQGRLASEHPGSQ